MNRLTLMQTQVPLPIRRSSSFPSSDIRRFTLQGVETCAGAIVATGTDVPTAEPAPATSLHIVPQTNAYARECTMLLTINADSINELRHLMMRTCRRLLVFIRTQPMAHAKKMKVWLCLNAPATDLVMDAVMRTLPSAEFGRVTYA